MKVNILGTKYKIKFRTTNEDKRLEEADGICDPSVRELTILDYEREPKDIMSYQDLKRKMNTTVRHEIIHAFFYESGLWHASNSVGSWAVDEEMIDWIAIQSPKLYKAFREVGCL